jgi:iron complex outermembrane receptor protein
MGNTHIAALMASTALAGAAFDSAAAAEAPTATIATIEEVVVTARRTEERLQDVPMAITAVSGDNLAKLNVIRFEEVTRLVPGLGIEKGSGGYNAAASLRGVTYQFSNASPTVGVFVNEVGLDANMAFQALYDVQSIEVLRGPQGTQRAASAPSGAIVMNTRRPTLNGFGGYVSGLGGSRNTSNLQGALNIPIISDVLALRIAAVHDHNRNGDVRSVNSTEKPFGNVDSYRLSLRYAPSDQLDAQLIYTRLDTKYANFNQVVGTGFRNPTSDPRLPPTGFNGPVISSGDRLAVGRTPSKLHQEADILVAQLTYDLDDTHRLTYVGGHTEQGYLAFNVQDPYNFIPSGAPFNQRLESASTIDSHEVRFERRPQDDVWSFGVGAFYNRNKSHTTVLAPNALAGFFGSPLGLPSVFTINPRYIGDATIDIPGLTKSYGVYGNLTFKFWDSELYLGGRLQEAKRQGSVLGTVKGLNALALPRLVPGVPFPLPCGAIVPGTTASPSYPAVGAFQVCDLALNAPTSFPNPLVTQRSTQPFLYSVSFTHHFTPDINGYMSVGTSWRDAGGNISLLSLQPAVSALVFLRPETSTAYEAGLKTTWLEGRVRFNAAVFQQDFKHHIFTAPQFYILADTNPQNISVGQTPANTTLLNAPARVRGFEFDAAWQVTSHWNLAGAFSYADGKLRNATIPCNPPGGRPTVAQLQAVGGVFTCSGVNDPISKLPLWTANLQSELIVPLGPLQGYLRGLLSYSPRNKRAGELPGFVSPSYSVVDLFGGVRPTDGGWELGAYVKNLFNEDALRSMSLAGHGPPGGAYPGDPEVGYSIVSAVQPRTYGVSARYSFGVR